MSVMAIYQQLRSPQCRDRSILSAVGRQGIPRASSENLTLLPSICLHSKEASMPSKRILLLAILALVYGFLAARVPASFASSKAKLPHRNRIGEAQTFKTL